VTYGNPSALLADALATFPQHRERFERDFRHFCAYSGISYASRSMPAIWARWAFWSAGDYNGSAK
jgi:hypothetical protein